MALSPRRYSGQNQWKRCWTLIVSMNISKRAFRKSDTFVVITWRFRTSRNGCVIKKYRKSFWWNKLYFAMTVLYSFINGISAMHLRRVWNRRKPLLYTLLLFMVLSMPYCLLQKCVDVRFIINQWVTYQYTHWSQKLSSQSVNARITTQTCVALSCGSRSSLLFSLELDPIDTLQNLGV